VHSQPYPLSHPDLFNVQEINSETDHHSMCRKQPFPFLPALHLQLPPFPVGEGTNQLHHTVITSVEAVNTSTIPAISNSTKSGHFLSKDLIPLVVNLRD
jgi:hypothetical protein